MYILKNNVYYCEEIVKKKIKARKVIHLLLDRLIPAVINGFDIDKEDSSDCLHALLISNNYAGICKYNISRAKNEKENLYAKISLVIDMISGMTDRYAYEVYELLS